MAGIKSEFEGDMESMAGIAAEVRNNGIIPTTDAVLEPIGGTVHSLPKHLVPDLTHGERDDLKKALQEGLPDGREFRNELKDIQRRNPHLRTAEVVREGLRRMESERREAASRPVAAKLSVMSDSEFARAKQLAEAGLPCVGD